MNDIKFYMNGIKLYMNDIKLYMNDIKLYLNDISTCPAGVDSNTSTPSSSINLFILCLVLF